MRACFISLLCLAAGGCAGDCGSDWYAVGQRDGVLGAGLEHQAAAYGSRCGAVNQARYAEGWREGFRARPQAPQW